jgi:histidine ammonia-lyase
LPAPPPLDLAADDGHPRRLTLADVLAVARGRRPVRPLEEDPARYRPLEAAMAATVAWVTEQVQAADAPPIYGINTGFGALAGRETFRSAYQARVLSRNLLTSHSAGVGPKLDEDVVRAGLLIRGHQLAQGRSGIRIAVVNRLFGLLNARVYPQVPSMGSLGASGDLAPLAHLALIISRPPEPGPGDPALPVDRSTGEAWVPLDLAPPDLAGNPGSPRHVADLLLSADLHQTRDPLTGALEWWRSVPGHVAMERAGGQIELEAKEGLALNNGATLSTALAALALADAERILDHAVLALAMTLEAIRGFCDPFLAEVHAARGFDGAAAVAARVLDYVKGSTLLDAADRDHDPDRVPPQDPYSVRCGPQVLGAAADSLAFIRRTVETEINAAVDNPLIFLDLPRDYKAVSCGNFHGAPIGYAMDLLKIVMTDCASQSERRTFKLTDYRFHDARRRELSLPAFLIDAGEGMDGLNSGLMIPQYTAAALVSAAKTLAHPDSVDSIPSSANQEDHVSMSMNAGLHARQILGHVEAVVAIELLTAAQALEFRRGQGRPGRGVAAAWDRIREAVPPLLHDRALAPDIEAVIHLMRSGALVAPTAAKTP